MADLRVVNALLTGAADALPSPHECLDDMGVAGAVDGYASEDDLAHIAACALCRGRVSAVARATADPAVAAETRGRTGSGTRRRRALAIGGVAAAAAVVLMLGREPAGHPATDPSTHRDPAGEVVAAPAPLSPVDAAVSRPVHLRWTAAPGATEYRVTVFDLEGSVVWNGEASDTTLALPETVALDAGETYWWRVEARIGFDRWVQSEITPFILQPEAR